MMCDPFGDADWQVVGVKPQVCDQRLPMYHPFGVEILNNNPYQNALEYLALLNESF